MMIQTLSFTVHCSQEKLVEKLLEVAFRLSAKPNPI
jgi:hypothetical protein